MEYRKLLIAPLIFASFYMAQTDSYAQGIPVELDSNVYFGFHASVESLPSDSVGNIPEIETVTIETSMDLRRFTQTATAIVTVQDHDTTFAATGLCKESADRPSNSFTSHFQCILSWLNYELLITMRWTTIESIVSQGGVPEDTDIEVTYSLLNSMGLGTIDVINYRILNHQSFFDSVTNVYL